MSGGRFVPRFRKGTDMNKRIRKKKYKELWHENPPKWLKLLKRRITRYKSKGNPYNLNFSFEIPKTEVEKLNQILFGGERQNL